MRGGLEVAAAPGPLLLYHHVPVHVVISVTICPVLRISLYYTGGFKLGIQRAGLFANFLFDVSIQWYCIVWWGTNECDHDVVRYTCSYNTQIRLT